MDGKSVAMGDTPVFETVHTSNAALFNRLGLSPLRISQGHHKKRLAGPEPPLDSSLPNHQSYGRRHGHKDSHVYIVKLPPSLPYYAITRPHKESVKGIKSSGNFPVGFQSNGKPGSIYHWNLPVMKKMAEKKRIVEHRMQMASIKQKNVEVNSNEIAKIDDSDTRIGSAENKKEPMGENLRFRNNDKRLSYGVEESGFNSGGDKEKNKNYRLDDSMVFKIKSAQNNEHRFNWNGFNDPHNSMYQNSMKQKKHRKKSATSYYAPFSTKSESTNLHKNFSGNGKPKAFYVIEKSRKPVYYHPLLP